MRTYNILIKIIFISQIFSTIAYQTEQHILNIIQDCYNKKFGKFSSALIIEAKSTYTDRKAFNVMLNFFNNVFTEFGGHFLDLYICQVEINPAIQTVDKFYHDSIQSSILIDLKNIIADKKPKTIDKRLFYSIKMNKLDFDNYEKMEILCTDLENIAIKSSPTDKILFRNHIIVFNNNLTILDLTDHDWKFFDTNPLLIDQNVCIMLCLQNLIDLLSVKHIELILNKIEFPDNVDFTISSYNREIHALKKFKFKTDSSSYKDYFQSPNVFNLEILGTDEFIENDYHTKVVYKKRDFIIGEIVFYKNSLHSNHGLFEIKKQARDVLKSNKYIMMPLFKCYIKKIEDESKSCTYVDIALKDIASEFSNNSDIAEFTMIISDKEKSTFEKDIISGLFLIRLRTIFCSLFIKNFNQCNFFESQIESMYSDYRYRDHFSTIVPFRYELSLKPDQIIKEIKSKIIENRSSKFTEKYVFEQNQSLKNLKIQFGKGGKDILKQIPDYKEHQTLFFSLKNISTINKFGEEKIINTDIENIMEFLPISEDDTYIIIVRKVYGKIKEKSLAEMSINTKIKNSISKIIQDKFGGIFQADNFSQPVVKKMYEILPNFQSDLIDILYEFSNQKISNQNKKIFTTFNTMYFSLKAKIPYFPGNDDIYRRSLNEDEVFLLLFYRLAKILLISLLESNLRDLIYENSFITIDIINKTFRDSPMDNNVYVVLNEYLNSLIN